MFPYQIVGGPKSSRQFYIALILLTGEFMFRLFMIKDDYINFCTKYDKKVQKNKEGNRKFSKKYLGVVLEVNNFKYFVPLSSYKPEKHDSMPEKIDFIRIEE